MGLSFNDPRWANTNTSANDVEATKGKSDFDATALDIANVLEAAVRAAVATEVGAVTTHRYVTVAGEGRIRSATNDKGYQDCRNEKLHGVLPMSVCLPLNHKPGNVSIVANTLQQAGLTSTSTRIL